MPRHSITLMVAAAASLLLLGGAQAAPPPPPIHALVLRALILDTVRGEPDYQAMTPALAEAVRPQMSVIRSELTALGPLKSLTFMRIDRVGAEIYRTTFEQGALEWAFSVNADGQIDNANWRTLPNSTS
jgi:hypothetical protein